MPCHVEESPAEIEARRRARTDAEIAKAVEPWMERANTLTHENDILREKFLDLIDQIGAPAKDYLGKEFVAELQGNQVEHRKEDLRRLTETFENYLHKAVQFQGKGAFQTADFQEYLERLNKVRQADPNLPLEPQLGFDPDKY